MEGRWRGAYANDPHPYSHSPVLTTRPVAKRSAAKGASGLSAYAFARKYQIAYTTLCAWRRRESKGSTSIGFTEVELRGSSAEALIIEVGHHARLRVSTAEQMQLAAQFIKHLEA